MTKKILIIGSHGFIGSHLTKALLLNSEYEVTCVDVGIFTGNPPKKIIEKRIKGLPLPDHSYQEKEYDIVIHLGSIAGVRSNINPSYYFANNNADLQLYLNELTYKKFIYISSSSVLGNVATHYSLSKQIAEAQVQRYCNNYTIIRPFTVYGEHGRTDMLVHRLLYNKEIKINGDPSKIFRYMTYVGDLVGQIVKIIELPVPFKFYNCIGHKQYSLEEVINITRKFNPRRGLTLKKSDQRDFKEYNISNGTTIEMPTRLEDWVKKLMEGKNVK